MSGGRLSEKQIHPVQRLTIPGGGLAEIDVPLAPLMQAMWNLRFTTLG